MYQIIIFRVFDLQQSPLHLFFLISAGDIYRLHGSGIQARIVHTGGYAARCGVKILHLLRIQVVIPQKFCQHYCVFHGASRVRRHQVGHQILFFAQLAVDLLKFLGKPLINLRGGFAHILKNPWGNMLRCYLQLAADMAAAKLGEKLIIFVIEQVIKSNAGTDKHLFNPLDFLQLLQQLQIVPVRYLQMLAGLRKKTLSALTHPSVQLSAAGRGAKVGRGTAHIMNIAFKALAPGQQLCFLQNGFVAARGDCSPLMKG